MDFTTFDYIIFSILGFFTLIGLIRGFIVELFSCLSWAGSIILTILLRPVITNMILEKTSNTMLANIIAGTLIFVFTIIGLSILTSNLARKFTTKFPTSINITLGIAFGFLKGFLISLLIFISMINVFSDSFNFNKDVGPKWFKNSAVYVPLSFATSLIFPSIDPIIDEMKSDFLKQDKKDNDFLKRFTTDNNEKENKEDKNEKDNGGYNKNQVEKLEHLIDLI